MSINPFDQQAAIPGIKNIIVVGSGKGGVGKSTMSANLALALKAQGRKVGLLDADIYGPSIPRLFGSMNQAPPVNEQGKIEPLQRHGIKLMSMGFLVDESQATVWRGPMLFKAIDQFFKDVNWDDLDDLVVDLPPGTGDIMLTIAQKVPVSGAIVVTTPQNIALADAKKAIDMFERVSVPVFGVVENMAYMKPTPDSEEIQLFPKGDLHAYLDAKKIPLLGRIPFETNVGMACEAGMPSYISDPKGEPARLFNELAQNILKEIQN